MAFINERVPQADKTHPIFQGGLRWPEYGPPVTPASWTIDRDRDVFITISSMGGASDQDAVYFIVGWKGQIVRADFDAKLGPSNRTAAAISPGNCAR